MPMNADIARQHVQEFMDATPAHIARHMAEIYNTIHSLSRTGNNVHHYVIDHTVDDEITGIVAQLELDGFVVVQEDSESAVTLTISW